MCAKYLNQTMNLGLMKNRSLRHARLSLFYTQLDHVNKQFSDKVLKCMLHLISASFKGSNLPAVSVWIGESSVTWSRNSIFVEQHAGLHTYNDILLQNSYIVIKSR